MKRLHVLITALALSFGCDGSLTNNETRMPGTNNANAANSVNNANSVDVDMGGIDADAADMGPISFDPIGRLNVTYWQPDAYFDYPELTANALFSKELAETTILNPVGWLARTEGWDVFLPDDFWTIPEPGESVDTYVDPETLTYTLLDAGDFVAIGDGVGDEVVAHVDDELLEADADARIYDALLEEANERATEEDLSMALTVEVEGGADITGALFETAVDMPAPIVLTNHDSTEPYPLRYGRDVVFEWEPDSADTIMLVGLETFDAGRVWRVDDAAGTANLNELAAAEGISLGDEPTFSLTRVRRSELQLREGKIIAHTAYKLFIYAERVTPYTVEPELWPAGKTTQVRVKWWDGTFSAAMVDAGPNVTVENVAIDDTAGNILTFDAVVAADALTGPVDLDVNGELTLEDVAWVATELPSAGDCASALDEGPVADGAYYASDDGLDWGLFATEFCPLGDPDGREQMIPVQVASGQRLRATLMRNDVPGALYLVKACDDVDDVSACAASPIRDRATHLEYWSPSDATLLLVVDGYGTNDGTPADYIVDIRRATPNTFTFEPTVFTEGATETLQVLGHTGDFTGSFSFGPGITVLDEQLYGNYAEVTITTDGTPITDTTIDVTAEVAGVSETVADSLTIAPYIASPADCAAADAAGALGPGTYEGLTALGGSGAVSPQPCLSADADGMEGIFRIDLGPSETLRAEVFMPGLDPVIYVMEACDQAVLACSDNTSDDRSEYVEWTGPATPSTVYLVVDGFSLADSDAFYLDLDIGL